MKHTFSRLATLTVSALLATTYFIHAQSTAFTYQGSLTQNGVAANGTFDLQFGLYTTASGGTATATVTNLAVGVTNGLFTTTLDFSNAFNGTPYFLDIGVRPNGTTGAFPSLTPRQTVGASPYALYAPNAGNVSGVVSITNLPPSVVLTNSSPTFSGTVTAASFVGNGGSLTNIPGSPTRTGYLFAYDLTSQAFPTGVNNYQPVSFSVAGTQLNGWALAPVGPIGSSTTFTASNSGIYLFEYQAQVAGTNGSVANFKATLNANNAEIAGSESAITLTGTNGVASIARSFITNLVVGDIFKLQFNASTTGVTLSPNGSTTVRPSITLTAIKIN